jgi:hypothetical protein
MGLALRFNILRDFANVIRDGVGAVIRHFQIDINLMEM